MVFSDTLLAPAESEPTEYRSNCAALLNGVELRDALRTLDYFEGDDRLPLELLSPTDEERAAGLRFWPAHGLPGDDGVHLYYLGIQTLVPDDPWGFRNVGAGLALLDPASGRCERVRVGDEWCLWSSAADDLHFGVQVLAADGFAYVFGSSRRGLDVSALVARVAPGRLAQPDAYEFFDPQLGEWVGGLEQAGSLGPCGGDYSVSFNRYLGTT